MFSAPTLAVQLCALWRCGRRDLPFTPQVPSSTPSASLQDLTLGSDSVLKTAVAAIGDMTKSWQLREEIYPILPAWNSFQDPRHNKAGRRALKPAAKGTWVPHLRSVSSRAIRCLNISIGSSQTDSYWPWDNQLETKD